MPRAHCTALQLLQRNVRRVVEQAVTAIASVADVAESDFEPYYTSFMPGLKGILQVAGGKEMRMLRGKAMECISLIGVAVGKERFGADAKEVCREPSSAGPPPLGLEPPRPKTPL